MTYEVCFNKKYTEKSQTKYQQAEPGSIFYETCIQTDGIYCRNQEWFSFWKSIKIIDHIS